MAAISLDLPIPPSVNRLRRVDWRGQQQLENFKQLADWMISAAFSPGPAPCRKITGPYQLTIAIPENRRRDLDNYHKAIIDYLVSREFTPDDRQLRAFTVRWAPIKNCHVTISEIAP